MPGRATEVRSGERVLTDVDLVDRSFDPQRVALFLGSWQRSQVSRVKRSRCRAIFMRPCIGVEGYVRAISKPICAACRPIDRWVKHVSATVGVPLNPRVRPAAQDGALADHQSNMLSAVELHPLIQRDSFAFAVSHRGRFNLIWRLPLSIESVWDCAQVFDPVIDQRERNRLIGGIAFGEQNRGNPAHLAIIRSGINGQIDGFGQTGEREQANETKDEGPEFASGERVDAYENHTC